jgi:hypothetical protein
MIKIIRDGQYFEISENGKVIGDSISMNGSRVLLNFSHGEYIDANNFTKAKIEKNPVQAIMTYFPNVDLDQEIKLINF